MWLAPNILTTVSLAPFLMWQLSHWHLCSNYCPRDTFPHVTCTHTCTQLVILVAPCKNAHHAAFWHHTAHCVILETWHVSHTGHLCCGFNTRPYTAKRCHQNAKSEPKMHPGSHATPNECIGALNNNNCNQAAIWIGVKRCHSERAKKLVKNCAGHLGLKCACFDQRWKSQHLPFYVGDVSWSLDKAFGPLWGVWQSCNGRGWWNCGKMQKMHLTRMMHQNAHDATHCTPSANDACIAASLDTTTPLFSIKFG